MRLIYCDIYIQLSSPVILTHTLPLAVCVSIGESVVKPIGVLIRRLSVTLHTQ